MNAPQGSLHALELARRVLEIEADAVRALIARLDERFLAAVALILACKGRVIVSGIGKSGHVARKIASTLASTGTPAYFVHPAEASHGDLGMIQDGDVFVAISYSGKTDELLAIVPLVKRRGAKLVAVSGDAGSALACEADVHLDASVAQEACPHNLAPTASTTAALALGDALAMALLDARGFKAEQFAVFHPEGSLGRRLLLRAKDVMHGGDELPRVAAEATFNDLILEMTRKHIGMACIVNADGTLLGVFTDGDLRRLQTRTSDFARLSAREAWRLSRRDPNDVPVPHSTVAPDLPAVECLQIMRDAQITSLVVANADKAPLGIVRMQDLIRAGLE